MGGPSGEFDPDKEDLLPRDATQEVPRPEPQGPAPGSATPPERTAPRATRRAPPPPPDAAEAGLHRCVIMGPSKVGKTAFLASIVQACHQPPRYPGDHVLSVVEHPAAAEPNDHRLKVQPVHELMRQAHEVLALRVPDLLDTAGANRIALSVGVRRASRGPLDRGLSAELAISVIDGQGSYLFPRADEAYNAEAGGRADGMDWAEQLMIREAKAASLVVLCLDASDRRMVNSLSRMTEVLGHLSEDQIVDEPRPTPLAPWHLMKRWLEPADARGPRRRMHATRVLVVLTKADRLVQRGLAGASPGVSALEIASMLDPLEQASWLVGRSAMVQIRNTMRHQAQLGICLTSAWGFCERTGAPYIDAQRAPGHAARRSTEEGRVLDWRPFGVRDALVFLATGECVGGCREVLPDSLYMDPSHRVRRGA
jgi:hypothetical protein